MRQKRIGQAVIRAAAGAAVVAVLAVSGFCGGESAPPSDTPPHGPAPSVKMDGGPNAAPAATPSEGGPASKGILTPGDIKELPNFNSRYDDATWAEMLQKGKALLSDVKDNTFEYNEEAFYWLVAHVNKMPADLMKPDKADTAFSVLLAQPAAFRGQAVTLSGIYWSVTPFYVPVAALRKDVPMLYACTILEKPIDAGKPIATVVTIEDPMKYLQFKDDVRVKAYFYKIRQFQGTQGIGSAPLLIAQRLEPMEPTPVQSVWSDPWMLPALGIILFLFGGFVLLKMITRGKPKHERNQPAYNKVHKFRLRRTDFPPPPASGGTGSEGGGPKP